MRTPPALTWRVALAVLSHAGRGVGTAPLALARAGATSSPTPEGVLATVSIKALPGASGSSSPFELKAVRVVDENFDLVPQAGVVLQDMLAVNVP